MKKGPIIVGLAALLVIILIASLIQFSTTGQAIRKWEKEIDDPIDLTLLPNVTIDISQIKSIDFKLQTSASSNLKDYTIDATRKGDYLIYTLREKDRTTTIAKGLLSEILTDTRGMYLDDDLSPDLELHYSSNLLKIINRNYAGEIVEGELSLVVKLDGKKISDYSKTLVDYNHLITLEVTVSSEVDVMIDDTKIEEGKPETKVALKIDEYEFNNIPKTIGPEILTVTATKGEDSLTKKYLLAADGVLYSLVEEKHPNVKMVMAEEDMVDLTITFPAGKKLPFSIPCSGSFSIESSSLPIQTEVDSDIPKTSKLQGDAFATILSLNSQTQRPMQYSDKLPSDFYSINPLNGYLLESNDGLVLRTKCSLTTELPSLNLGWNLVGITGYQARDLADLDIQNPPGKKRLEIHEVLEDEDTGEEVTKLEPGKAYWVKIG